MWRDLAFAGNRAGKAGVNKRTITESPVEEPIGTDIGQCPGILIGGLVV